MSSKEDIKNLINKIAEGNWKAGYDKLLPQIDGLLRDFFRSMPELVKVVKDEVITVRASTFQSVLSVFSREWKSDFQNALRSAGEEVGASFAHSFVKTLKEHTPQQPPAKYALLIDAWAGFDFSANWATKFAVQDFDESKDHFKVRLENSFLTRDLTEDHHRHCGFMEGYIKALLNEAFLEWIRWLPYPPPQRRTCSKVHETSSEPNLCEFDVQMGHEILIKTRDKYLRALEKLDSGEYSEADNAIRTVLEFGLKERVRLDPEDRTFNLSFPQLCDIYQRAQIKLPLYAKAKDVYNWTSAAGSHGASERTKEKVLQSLEIARRWLGRLEELPELDRSKEKIIVEFILSEVRRPSTKTAGNSGGITIEAQRDVILIKSPLVGRDMLRPDDHKDTNEVENEERDQ